ncbi:MAG TPA: hypothetical protein VFJ66_01850, partial [Gaiellales bacterium]|nr:hypothetical protein [Gaiellales bacterium]
SSFLEVQFYPPGEGPFVDNISCDNTHWCASLHINDAECDQHFNCNPNCVEPTNFAFIQTNGVPTGPPSPQLMTLQSNTPNSHTLLMNPGDRLRVHIFDAPVPDSGARALKVRVDDLTTGRSGFMQASARNGYMATRYTDCSGVPFNYRPEYSTAKPQNSVPWAALEVNIATEYEIGHFTPCTKLYFPTLLQLSATVSDTMWQVCQGAYERTNVGDEGVEETDAPCYPRGDTHGGLAPPNIVTGCVSFFGAGDVDFDGTSYWPDWPDSLTPNRHPSPFLQQQPTSRGSTYPLRQFQTDAAASEVTCQTNGQGCSVPPPAPLGPGHFYPYWTQARVNGTCVWEFGRMRNGNTFGGARQYGHPALRWYFGNLEGPITRNTNCAG